MLYENHPCSRTGHYSPQNEPNNKGERVQNAGSFERELMTWRRVLGDADRPAFKRENITQL